MSSRFATNLCVLLLGAFLAVACFAFGSGTLAWLALGVASAAVLLGLVGFALRDRGAVQRVLDLTLVVAGSWGIVASREFGGGTLKWLALGAAALLATLAVIGLIAHEMRTVHAANEYATHDGDRVHTGVFEPYAPDRQAAA